MNTVESETRGKEGLLQQGWTYEEIPQRLWRCRHLHVEEERPWGGYRTTQEHLLMLTDIYRHEAEAGWTLVPKQPPHEEMGMGRDGFSLRACLEVLSGYSR